MTLMVSVSGVRGIVGPELNPEVIGRWVGALAQILPPGPVVVGRDSRPSGEALAAVAAGCFGAAGREVFEVGLVPTPTVQVAVEEWDAAGGVILSASHNPAPWNALKFVDRGGSFLSPERFLLLREAFEKTAPEPLPAQSYGRIRGRHEEALAQHLDQVLRLVDRDRIGSARLRVVIECGHGAGGVLLPRLAEELGVEAQVLHQEPSGRLLDDPEPSEQSLTRLADRAAGARLAIMVDPDADRCGLALPGTAVIGEEWTLPLVTAHRLETKVGTVVTNLSTSSRMDIATARKGANLVRTPVGEAHVVAEMRRVDAVIGGEGNGGVIDPRAHLGRDSAVAFALLCEADARTGLRELAAGFPERVMRKEKVVATGIDWTRVTESLSRELGPADDSRDGLWWKLPAGFLHVRASNTEPILRVVVESASDRDAREVAGRVREAIE
jgi:phosphomannomutase